MYQDVTTIYYAAKAEERARAAQAERAWQIHEALRAAGPGEKGAIARIGAVAAAATRYIGRRARSMAAVAPATRRRSAGAS